MIEIKRILCPVDFSQVSRRALDHALGLARCYGSAVTVLHVVPDVGAAVTGPYYAASDTPLALPPIDRDFVAAQLEQFIRSEQVPGLRVDTRVENAPEVYREILAQADERDANLIVIGTHGRSGFERLFLGSTAEKVLRKARCPVMTVPPHAPEAMPRGPEPFAKILCAVDFSSSSKLALEYAISIAQESKGTLALLHVIESIPLYYDFTPPAVVDLTAWTEEAARRLREMVPGSVRSSCSVTESVAIGRPYREILNSAAALASDVIVMGVQGRGAADLFFFGSTTHHVIREARCAVLTLRG